MPHVLIAGATGMGKSVGINTIIASLLYRLHPSEVKFILVDPKKIELSIYLKLQHHFLAVSPDIDEKIITQPNNAVLALKSCVIEMERRYDLLASAGVRHVSDYNQRFKEGRLRGKDTDAVKHRFLPYIIVIIDELADLMMTTAKEVEESIARIAQLARAVGIHLVLATQRPSVDVITGVIKANFPSRIAYAVSSRIDSRTILDAGGAEQLIGRGDMLYQSSSSPKPIRIQNAFISSDEIEQIVEHIGGQKGYTRMYELPSALEKKKGGMGANGGERDEFFDDAARIIVRHQQGSVSLLQRRLSIGYSRAARLVDQLEDAGIVGPFDGSKAREVLIETEEQLEILLKNLD
jgi:S-DNA-T family DNA segregation ATPase FtsK/SpoIIIE